MIKVYTKLSNDIRFVIAQETILMLNVGVIRVTSVTVRLVVCFFSFVQYRSVILVTHIQFVIILKSLVKYENVL